MSGLPGCHRSVDKAYSYAQPQSMAQEMWGMGKIIMVMPGLFNEVASEPARPAQPLRERIGHQMMLGLMGSIAVCAIPFWLAQTGVVFVVEKAIGVVDALHGIATRVEYFGHSLEEQKRIIEKFDPLLELSKTVEEISSKVKAKTDALKQNTEALRELAANYPANARLLEIVSIIISRSEKVLEALKTEAERTGIQEKSLQVRAAIVKQIEDEEHRIKKMTADLLAIITRVEEKKEKEKELTERAGLRAQKKEGPIQSLRQSLKDITKGETL